MVQIGVLICRIITPKYRIWMNKVFHQLWSKYPIKVGKHKVSDAQITKLYSIGKNNGTDDLQL